MHVGRDSILVSVVLAAWVLLYGYALNVIRYPFSMAICGALIVLIVGLAVLIRSDRKGVPFAMAYIAYIILTLFSLAKSIHPAVRWASEFLVFSVLSVVFVAFYDILTRVSNWELMPQLILLYALAVALLNVDGWVLIALLGLATALVCSMRSLVGYLMSLVFALLPFIGVPAVIYNAGNLPHITLPGLRVGSIAYVTALVVTYIASAIAGGVGGILAMTSWKSLTRLEKAPHILRNAFSIAMCGVVFSVIVIVFTYLLAPWLNVVLIVKSVALTLISAFVSALLINTALLRREVRRLLKDFEERSESLLYVLDNVREAVNALTSVGMANEKVGELRSQTNEIIMNLRRVKEHVSRNPSPDALKSAFNELDIIEKNVTEVKKGILDAFTSLTTTVQSLKPIMDPYVRVPEDLWLKAVTATKVEEVEDVLIKANALHRIAEKLCAYLEKALDQSLRELGKILGVEVAPKETMKCSDWRDPISALKGIMREYTSILARNKHAIQETYSKLLKLKEVFLTLEKDLRENDLQSTNFGMLLSEASSILSEIPDVMPSAHSAIRIIKDVTERLREIIAKLPKALKADLNLLLEGSRANTAGEMVSTLYSLSNASERLNYLCEAFENLSKEGAKGSYAQLIAMYDSALPKLLRRATESLRELAVMCRRTGLIPVVMEYIDYLLTKKGGTLSLEELPFKRDASIHFIQLYALSRKDVEVLEGGIRVKGGEQDAQE